MMRTPMLKRHLRDRDKVGHFLGSVVYMGAVVCLTLVNPTLVPGQRPEYLEPQAQGEKAPPSFEWTGEQLPKFVVVRKYFRVLDNCRAMGQGAYTRMLNRLGISKNTVAEQKLLEALVKAKANEKLRVDLTPHLNKDRDSFMQIQYESLRQRVHGLRKIYRVGRNFTAWLKILSNTEYDYDCAGLRSQRLVRTALLPPCYENR